MKDKVSRHQRFYFPPSSLEKDLVYFPRDESSHMVASLRLAVNDIVCATDGAGKVYEVEIHQARRGRVVGKILGVTETSPSRPLIWVFQGVIRPTKMDFLVEKCVELGIAGFVAVECERSVRKVAEARLGRWRRIAIEAMKQSLRSYLPEICKPQNFESAAGMPVDSDLTLVASETERGPTLTEAVKTSPARVALWVGPEGGFTDCEVGALVGGGAIPFSLGPYRLRSETAALASLAILHGLPG